jgi:hypothetical protein
MFLQIKHVNIQCQLVKMSFPFRLSAEDMKTLQLTAYKVEAWLRRPLQTVINTQDGKQSCQCTLSN